MINEVSLCRDPVNPMARVALVKSQDPEPGIRAEPGTVTDLDGAPRGPPEVCDYWQALINEKTAAVFLGVEGRTLQSYRQRGGGPKYIALSSRCLRYRRIWLLEWTEARVRTSTSDPGKGAA